MDGETEAPGEGGSFSKAMEQIGGSYTDSLCSLFLPRGMAFPSVGIGGHMVNPYLARPPGMGMWQELGATDWSQVGAGGSASQRPMGCGGAETRGRSRTLVGQMRC